MYPIEHILSNHLEKRKKANAFRALPQQAGLIDFCSNDYLGLARENLFVKQPETQNGATGSRLISGNFPLTEKLETEIASFHRAPSALIYNSGYVANLGLLSCIAERQDTILFDELAHASIREGLLLSNARTYKFRHNDVLHLEDLLKRSSGRRFVVVESVYSMDGDCAPLIEIAELCDQYQAALIVDEAHGTGVFGEKGEGLVVAMSLEDRVWARVHTFGKALGVHGAAVLGSIVLRDYLINFSRAFIYTTALPPPTLQTIGAAYSAMKEGPLLELLRQRIRYFKEQLSAQLQSCFIESNSSIQCLLVPGNQIVKKLAGELQEAGFAILPILHPTVPKGQERLRICIHAFNSEEEISRMVNLLNVWATKAEKV